MDYHKINITPFNIHVKGSKKDIVILTSGRSGGTWLLELLSHEKKIKSFSEPLSLGLVTHTRKRDFGSVRPDFGYPFIKVPPKAYNYFRDIFKGNFNPFSPLKSFRKNPKTYHYYTNRVILKICHGKGLINWFYENFNVDLIYFYRHPIPTAMSMIKRNFNTKITGFLSDENFKAKYLDQSKLDYIEKIESTGTELEKFVLSWALENLIPFKTLMLNKQIINISYEEFSLYPNESIKWISNRLELNPKEMLKHFYKKSSTTVRNFEKTTYTSNRIVDSWKHKVDTNIEKKLMKILSVLEIDLYSYDNFLPNNKYLQKELNI